MEKSGIVIVNKEAGMTSQTVVNRVKRLFGVKKAGHTGTLDPMACGVLPVLIGRAVKASEFMLTEDKHYRAQLTLGIETDTEDTTGNIISRHEVTLGEGEVVSAAKSFVGKYRQTPPMYSAIKIGGKKLYELAREGIVIEREARDVEIYGIDCRKTGEVTYSLDVHCSKGTYIRTLCADIGKKLGTGGAMSALTRTIASGFDLGVAHTLSEIEEVEESVRDRFILPVEVVFNRLPLVALPDFFARLAKAGQEIYLHKIGKDFDVGTRVKLYDEKGFFAVGEIMEFEAGRAIKPIRQF